MRLIDEVNQEMTELDDNYTGYMWFSDIDDKVFSFKHRIHNWLKEREVLLKFERKSKSSGKSSKSSGSKSLKSNQLQVPDHPSCQPERKQYKKRFVLQNYNSGIVYEEKMRCIWQAGLLRLEEEMEKARARVRIYENKNQDQEVAFKI